MSINPLTRPRRRRRRYPLSAVFEAAACRRDGAMVRGTPYRRGARLQGDACSYQFSVHDLEKAAIPSAQAEAVWQHLQALLEPQQLDILCWHRLAGWRFTEIAARVRQHPTTVARQLERIGACLREDPVLRALLTT